MRELVVPEVQHLYPMVSGKAGSEGGEAVEVHPHAVPLEREVPQAAVGAQKTTKKGQGGATDVVSLHKG